MAQYRRPDPADLRSGNTETKNSLNVKVLRTSNQINLEPEYIILEVVSNSTKLIFCCLYRPPDVGHMDTFLTEFFDLLPSYKYAIACGDFNARFGSGEQET